MSGGRLYYQNDRACNEIFRYEVYPDYGMGMGEYADNVKRARKLNPMEDIELTELVYDVFCLIHSLDCYRSGDTGEDTYFKDVEYFKNKWLRGGRGENLRRIITERIDSVREELLRMV